MNNERLKTAKTQVEGFRADLDLLGPPHVVSALVAQVRAWSKSTLAMITEQKNEVSMAYGADYANWNGIEPADKTPAEDSRWGTTLRAAGIAAVVLESCFAGILAALTFNLPVAAAAATGVLMTIAITLVFKGAWRIFTSPEEGRPRKAAKLLSKQLLVVFPTWLLAIAGGLLLGRAITESTAFMNTLFSMLMTLLTILSPALAAILLTFSEVKGWAKKHVDQWRALENLETQVHELEAYCEAVERRISVDPGTQPGISRDSGGVRGLAATAAALLLFACGTNLRASDCRNQIWVDLSGSPSTAEMRSAVDRTLAVLPYFSESECGRDWDLYGFAGAAFSATPFHTIKVPQRPKGECQLPSPISEMGVLFRNVAKATQAERQQACEKMMQHANAGYLGAIDAEMSQAREKLTRYQVPDPDRTCIVDLLQRLSDGHDAARRALILTDAEETCDRSFRGPIAPPSMRSAITMVIVPQQRKAALTPAQYYTRMKDAWIKIAQWVNVIPPYGINEAMFSSAAGGAAERAVARRSR